MRLERLGPASIMPNVAQTMGLPGTQQGADRLSGGLRQGLHLLKQIHGSDNDDINNLFQFATTKST